MRKYKLNYEVFLRQKSLIGLMLGAILAAGVFFRVAGFDTHVTYIDELMCLTEGGWNSRGEESSHNYKSPWDFAKKIASNDGVTYAPLQFLLTYYFVKPYEPLLSPEALAASRIPSVICGCLSMVLLFLLFYTVSKGRLSYSFLLPLTLLAVSRINIVNSQQNHTYIIGVLGFIAAMLALVWLYDSRRILVWAGAAAVLCVLPFANYQLVPIVILGIGLVLCAIWITAVSGKDRKAAYLKTLLLMPVLATSVLFARWIMEHKGANSISWWTVDFGFKLSGEGFFGKLSGLIKNIYFVFESILLSGDNRAINLLAVTAVILIILGAFAILIYKRPRLEINVLPLALSVAAFGLFICLYFAQAIALSPSRHTLILTPAVLVVVFYGSRLIENFIAGHKTALRGYQCLLAGLSALVLLGAVAQYPEFHRKKTEAFQAQKLLELGERENIRLVMTDGYSYNKLYMFLAGEIAANRIELGTVGDEYDFPDEPFLLVGQNIEGFYPLYRSGHYEFGSFSRLLYEHSPRYDFEPSPRIDFYWPNRMLVYRVDPPAGGKLLQPECSRGNTDAPAEATTFFLQSAWQKNQYLNVENGLKSSPIESAGWVSAQWELAQISDSPVIHYTIQNRRTGEYLYIDSGDGGKLKTGAPAEDTPPAQKYWVFELVDDTPDEYRIRNMHAPALYINIENQLDENGDHPEYGVQASEQQSDWVSPRWRLCDSTP